MKNDSIDEICGNPFFENRIIMKGLLEKIKRTCTRSWNIMEVCGGQTNTIAKYGLEKLLSPDIRMLHGPGCPVCVTPQSIIDYAIQISKQPNVVLCSFGDMLRVPGTQESLLMARTEGADVQLLYSPLDIISMAEKNTEKQFVFFAIGFETTMPIYALLVKTLKKRKIENVSILTSLFTVPAAVKAVKADNESDIDALLAAGHVCAVVGESEYVELAQELDIPIIITGFEPVDILEGVLLAVRQLESGEARVENPYFRVVHTSGNVKARNDINEVFEPCDMEWRGIGKIKKSGRRIVKNYEHYDARLRFPWKGIKESIQEQCISGSLMKGQKLPSDCSCFGTSCTPEHPIGAPMVSSEGICSAFYANKKI